MKRFIVERIIAYATNAETPEEALEKVAGMDESELETAYKEGGSWDAWDSAYELEEN